MYYFTFFEIHAQFVNFVLLYSMYIAVKVTPDLFVKHLLKYKSSIPYSTCHSRAFLVNICTCWLDANKHRDLKTRPAFNRENTVSKIRNIKVKSQRKEQHQYLEHKDGKLILRGCIIASFLPYSFLCFSDLHHFGVSPLTFLSRKIDLCVLSDLCEI